MRRLYSCIIAATAIAAAAFPAIADNYKVAANKTTGLVLYYTYLEDTCAFGSKPTFKILTPPSHGKITSKWMKIKLEKVRKNCQGKPVYGMGVFYTPDKGYHGKDSARIGLGDTAIAMAVPSGSRAISINLTVE